MKSAPEIVLCHRSVLCVVGVAATGVRLSFSPDRVKVSGAVGDSFRVIAVRMVEARRAGIIAVRRGLSHGLLREGGTLK